MIRKLDDFKYVILMEAIGTQTALFLVEAIGAAPNPTCDPPNSISYCSLLRLIVGRYNAPAIYILLLCICSTSEANHETCSSDT